MHEVNPAAILPMTSPRHWRPTRLLRPSSKALAQFYRKAYLRYIDATTRRPDLRAARIAEVVDLLADGIKERPRP